MFRIHYANLGLTPPIVNAGVAMITRSALAAAVCEAGGLGTVGPISIARRPARSSDRRKH